MKKRDERFEALLCEGIDIKERMATDRAKLLLIENELDRYFAGAVPLEQVSCEYGTAVRFLSDDIFIDPALTHEVLAMLGSQFARYFTTHYCCRPTKECLELLQSADSHLSQALRPYLFIKPVKTYALTKYSNPLSLMQSNENANNGGANG